MDGGWATAARDDGEMGGGRGDVDVVVCVHNALEDVRRCLRSVVELTAPPYRLILVDDASDPACRDELARFAADHPAATLLRHDERRGYTRSANAGLRASRAGLVVLLNSDTVVTPGWLERLRECAASDPAIGLVGPLSNAAGYQSVPERFDAEERFAVNALPAGWAPEDVARVVDAVGPRAFPRVGFLNGFCLAIKREAIEAVGYLDEEGFPDGYGEETDYCLRAAAAGFACAVADHAYVFHAKTRSYSPGRRAALAGPAGAVLRRKHPAARLKAAIARTYDEPTLAAMREAVADYLQGVSPFPGQTDRLVEDALTGTAG